MSSGLAKYLREIERLRGEGYAVCMATETFATMFRDGEYVRVYTSGEVA